jgi:hypothetical protein
MSRTTWNGATVATNGDTYDVTGWIGKGIETSGLVIPITQQSQRDGLAAAYGATTEAGTPFLPPGTTVVRLDLPGAPLERWNGSTWQRSLQLEVKAATTSTPQFKVGTVTASSDGNGAAALVFDTPFDHAIFGAVCTQATAANIGAIQLQYDEFLSNPQRAAFYVYDMAGGLVRNLVNFRASYLAFGH